MKRTSQLFGHKTLRSVFFLKKGTKVKSGLELNPVAMAEKSAIPSKTGEEKDEVDFMTWRDRFFEENSRRWEEHVKLLRSLETPAKPPTEKIQRNEDLNLDRESARARVDSTQEEEMQQFIASLSISRSQNILPRYTFARFEYAFIDDRPVKKSYKRWDSSENAEFCPTGTEKAVCEIQLC